MHHTAAQRKLVTAIRDYAQNTLDGKCPDEGTCFLSALVNTVDSALEGSISGMEGRQAQRERVLVEFLVAHDNCNRYDL